jgi:DNA-binding XRE family transcriptional regulator
MQPTAGRRILEAIPVRGVNGDHSGMRLPNLRRVRERRAWSQADLARRAGVGKNTVARLEGQGGAHPRTAAKLAEALGVEPAVLMTPDRQLAAAMRPPGG